MCKDAIRRLQPFSETLYEDRWGYVVAFIRKLRPLLPLLARVWNKQRYTQNVDGGGEEKSDDGLFDLDKFGASLRSPLFWLELDTVLAVEGIVLNLAAWSESCPCHWAWLGQMSRRERERYMSSFLDFHGRDVCPLAGRRAPELAANQLHTVLDELASNALTDLLNGDTAVVKKSKVRSISS